MPLSLARSGINTSLVLCGPTAMYLLLGVGCRTPTEAALLPPHELEAAEVSDYREVTLSHSAAKKLAADSIRTAQLKYKAAYDRNTRKVDYIQA